MGIIVPENREVLSFRGLHLYHFAGSNCSQKVRMALEEKGLPWTSRHLDLAKNEHVTPEYMGINPNGVVPTLVHDGRVVIESSDILDYLDKTFPEPPLQPHASAEQEHMHRYIALQDSIQRSLKILSHEFLFKPRRRLNQKELERFEKIHRDPDLVAFHRAFSSPEGLGREVICEAIRTVNRAFSNVEERLSKHEWLAGEHFSLADIAWAVCLHRFAHMRFPMEQYPGLQRWYLRVSKRQSFRQAVLAYEPRVLRIFFHLYTSIRHLTNKDVGSSWWCEGVAAGTPAYE